MLTYTLRRLVLIVPTLFGITLVTFLIINLAPRDPVEVIQGGTMSVKVSPESYQQMKRLYGLDRPLPVRVHGRPRSTKPWPKPNTRISTRSLPTPSILSKHRAGR